jgi:dihydroorotate dehydrogenase
MCLLAIRDYVTAFVAMEKYADYLTVNLSCPNTSGGMPFLLPENYDNLMTEIDKIETSTSQYL